MPGKHSQAIFFSLAPGEMQLLFKINSATETELALGRTYPPQHCCRQSKAWALGASQRVLSSWAGDMGLQGPGEVLVSHESVWALQLKSSKNPQEELSNTRKLGGWGSTIRRWDWTYVLMDIWSYLHSKLWRQIVEWLSYWQMVNCQWQCDSNLLFSLNYEAVSLSFLINILINLL